MGVETQSNALDRRRLLLLFCVSFTALALEVLLIRWVGSEIHVFSFFKNLILMAAFLGMGIGCSQPVKDASLDSSPTSKFGFGILLLLVVLIVSTSSQTGLINISLLVDPDVFDFSTGVGSAVQLAFNIVLVCGIYFLVVKLFDLFGRELGKQLHGLPPLPAYTTNLAGSICGTVVVFLLSFMGLNPAVWLAISLLPMLFVYWTNKKQLAFFFLTICFCCALAQSTTGTSIWSPYYRIDLEPSHFWLKGGNQITEPYRLGTIVMVNHAQHQRSINLSPAFLAEHPELKMSNELRAYDLPYSAWQKPGNVLILGAGTGNDVAAALRNGATRVDAVEIDPAIRKLGESIHPEKPYADKRVVTHLTDARAFLASNKDKYKLVAFGLLDSHTALSTMSSVRLDNYLYTRESLASATSHLSTDGVAALSFATQPEWLRARLFQLVKSVSGSQPLALNSRLDSINSIMILWGPGLDAVRQSLSSKYADILVDPASLAMPVDIPTDDWPFLYQRAKNVPAISLVVLALVLFVSAVLIFGRFRLRAQTFLANLQMFLLGTAFFLMETRAILAISILFASTWIVNSIVIAIVLFMALAANLLISRLKIDISRYAYLALFASLVLLYCLPLASLAGLALPLKLVASFLILGTPFFCSGLVFSSAFSKIANPELGLGINILGTVLGGCLEYLATVIGINNLTLMALAVYLASYFAAKLQPGSKTPV